MTDGKDRPGLPEGIYDWGMAEIAADPRTIAEAGYDIGAQHRPERHLSDQARQMIGLVESDLRHDGEALRAGGRYGQLLAGTFLLQADRLKRLLDANAEGRAQV